MFIGHFAAAFAAKRVAPRVSLGTLVAAAQLLDLLWPPLILLGVEEVRVAPGRTAFTPLDFERYPWSHSLVMAVVWALVFGAGYAMFTRRDRAAWVVGGLVLSHWVLDFASHGPDLPLAFGPVKVGLGLWNSVPATIAVEGALFAFGVYLYATGTRSRNRTGSVALWALVVFLSGIYVASLGPPPPSARAVAVAGLLTWLFVPWAHFIDRNRDRLGLPARAAGMAPP